jgi:DNA-binding transcriptional LysR family regulator
VVNIAASDYAMALLLPPLLKRLQETAPKLKVAVRPVNGATLEAEMRERSVDLAFTVPQFTPAGLHSHELFRELYRGAVREGHPLSEQHVTLDSFCSFPHVLVAPYRGDFSGPTDVALAALGRKRDIALVVPSFSVVAAMLEATDLVAVLPGKLLAQTRRKLHVFDTPIPVEGFALHAFWPERVHADPLQHWLRQLCFDCLPT